MMIMLEELKIAYHRAYNTAREAIESGVEPDAVRAAVVLAQETARKSKLKIEVPDEFQASHDAFGEALQVVNRYGSEDAVSGRPANPDIESMVDVWPAWYREIGQEF